MRINAYTQILVGQLNNLYKYIEDEWEDKQWYLKSWMCCADTHLLYDFLKERGDMTYEIDKEIKDLMWRLAKLKFNNERQSWIKQYNSLVDGDHKKDYKKMMDKERANMYKSFLIRYMAAEMFYKTGKKTTLHYGDDTLAQQLTITGR